MPTAQFIKDGRSIDHTPPADVAAGDVVVQGELVGVAHLGIPAGTKGSINCSGIYEMPKATGFGRSVDVGVRMHWRPSHNQLVLDSWVPPGSGEIYAGKTVEPATNGDGKVRLRLDQ